MEGNSEIVQIVTGKSHLSFELSIPVPWGHISVKTWNDPCGWPVLCVHGLQDNAGTFDRLIPLLPSTYHFVSVDLPGHGRSSHFPSGVPLNFLDYVTAVKRIVNHMKWTKCIYLGHSLGGQIGAFFTAMFPESVSKLIMLDSITTSILPSQSMLKRQRRLFDNLLETERKLSMKEPPKYTYKEAITRMVESRNSKLNEEAANSLITRSLIVSSDGYRFTTDQRLKYGLRPLIDMSQHMEVVSLIVCPHLIILAQETVAYFSTAEMGQIFEAYKMKPNFAFTVVDGNHDVHNNNPERVAPIITSFLSTLKCTL